MSLDLIKLALILFSFLRHGSPSDWDVAVQAGFHIAVPDPSVTLSVGIDPVPIYKDVPLSGKYCGMFDGAILINTEARIQELGCTNTLAHETAHAWQYRSFGLLLPLIYIFDPMFWEPEDSSHSLPSTPRVLNYPLFRIPF